MTRTILSILFLSAAAAFLSGCTALRPAPSETVTDAVPREFRAAWVATVHNINWPSRPGLPVDRQKQEALDLLDFLAAHNFNAVILQVRPQCDALYPSDLEPWSHYLTGEQGTPPEPVYDPLAFWIATAHDRGLELHAWFNPYRAHASKSALPPTSIARARPDLAKPLANGMYWLNPTHPEARDHSLRVILDVVRRYDIDGVHFDDYFYPYASYNNGADFPDDDTWQAYQARGGGLSRSDWRREAVNRFIQRLSRDIKKEKPHVKFGISPFGIWRPGHPASIRGLDQYESLYADARLWLQRGWIDYFSPQLYWPIKKIPQSFPVLLGWWQQQNIKHRHLWPGISLAAGPDECLNQIMITRGMLPNSPGAVHWNVDTLRKNNNEIARVLLEGPYARPALVPAFPWLKGKPLARPGLQITCEDDGRILRFSHPDASRVFRWIVSVESNGRWTHTLLPGTARELTLPDGPASAVALTAVDRTGRQSPPALRKITQ